MAEASNNKSVFDVYDFIRIVDSGFYSKTFLVKSKKSSQFYFVKATMVESEQESVRREAHILHALNVYPGFQKYEKGGTGHGYDWLVVNILGPTMEDLFNLCSRKFTLPTVLMIFAQMLERLSVMHNKKIVHRNIKPANIRMGIGNQSKMVYLVDLSLAKLQFDGEQNQDVRSINSYTFVGAPEFTSKSVDEGYECTPRDDLISLCYTMVYFLKGTLPWMNIRVSSDQQGRLDDIRAAKKAVSNEDLCSGLPGEFYEYFYNCSRSDLALDYLYTLLRESIKKLASAAKINMDHRFDWILIRDELEATLEEKAMRSTSGGKQLEN